MPLALSEASSLMQETILPDAKVYQETSSRVDAERPRPRGSPHLHPSATRSCSPRYIWRVQDQIKASLAGPEAAQFRVPFGSSNRLSTPRWKKAIGSGSHCPALLIRISGSFSCTLVPTAGKSRGATGAWP
jgi:hypothetical protein